MPRNGSGTMSVANSFSSGSTISSSAMNANFTDIATEITGSLPRDGQAAMTGQFKGASGTVALPGISFSSDTDTGFYRKSANTIGVVAGGAEVGSIDADGFKDADGINVQFPAGTAMLFVQTTAPTGWTKSTTHNDKALRVVSGTASSGGTTAFSSVFAARTISTSNLPSHTHTGTTSAEGNHQHAYTVTSINNLTGIQTGGGAAANSSGSATSTGGAGAHSHTFTTDATGGGTAMDFAVQYVDTIIATKD